MIENSKSQMKSGDSFNKTCLCGCGGLSKNRFLPGHDQKLRTSFEKSIGGAENLLRLKQYVDEKGADRLFKLLETE